MSSKRKSCLRIIRRCSRGLDYLVLFLSILLLAVGGYAYWDTHQVFQAASSEEYALYKPKSDERLSFEELRERNGDVRAWIDIYGTKIDYPIVQGKDNSEYLNKTVLGEFSTAGSIFLDHRNAGDFSDYQNILYGHYMAERKMFGDMELYHDEKFFQEHAYGQLHGLQGKHWGIEFFAFVETVGTDQAMLSPAVKAEDKKGLIDHIYQVAKYSRAISFGEKEHLLVLDTCDLTKTNGRFILVGRLTDQVMDNPYQEEAGSGRDVSHLFDGVYTLPVLYIIFPLWLLLLLLYLLYRYDCRRRERKEEMTRIEEDNP